MGTDVIGLSWNAEALQRGGVHRIAIKAYPKDKSLPIVRMKINTSEGKTLITGDIKPSTTYVIRIVDMHKRGFVYSLGEVTTPAIGELALVNVFSFLIPIQVCRY